MRIYKINGTKTSSFITQHVCEIGMVEQDTEELLSELIEITKQNERWLKILAREHVEEAVKTTLSDKWEYKVYEESDGEKSTYDLAAFEEVPVSDSTVGRRLQKWRQVGIVEQTPSGRYEKIVSLDHLGIEIPEEDD